MPVSPDEAARRIAALTATLASDDAAAAFATAWVDQAQKKANTYPTPQARMAASGISADGSHVVGPEGRMVQTAGRSVPLGDVLFGSEFGSTVYTQFGPRSQHGYWLFPTANDPLVMETFEVEFVDRAISVTVRG